MLSYAEHCLTCARRKLKHDGGCTLTAVLVESGITAQSEPASDRKHSCFMFVCLPTYHLQNNIHISNVGYSCI